MDGVAWDMEQAGNRVVDGDEVSSGFLRTRPACRMRAAAASRLHVLDHPRAWWKAGGTLRGQRFRLECDDAVGEGDDLSCSSIADQIKNFAYLTMLLDLLPITAA